jgi:hypothetical protein
MANRSDDETTNPEAAGLKGKRASTRTPPPGPGRTPLSQDMAGPQPVPEGTPFHGTLAARHPAVLLDPAAMPVVREGVGFVSEAPLSKHYVTAGFSATESILPPGCTTPISRVLWHKGNQVRRDAYELYLEKYGHPDVTETAEPAAGA